MKLLEIFFGLGAAILAAIVTYKWKELDGLGRLTLIFVIVAAVFVAVNSYRKETKEQLIERINATFGEISDAKDAGFPKLQIGAKGATFVLLNGVFDFQPFGPLIKLYVKNDKLCVYTIVRNRAGEVLAVIDDNTWTLFSKDYEYNNDENAFELVTKGERKVYFQLELKDGIAHISGFLFNDKGVGINFVDSPELNGSSLNIITPASKFDIMDYSIKRLFKYPREKYYGVRVD